MKTVTFLFPGHAHTPRGGNKVIYEYARQWFDLDKRVHEHWTFSLNYRHVPRSDLYVCTSPYAAMYLKDYPIDNMRKYYFIQDYENWEDVTDEKLRATYHYPLQKIVISKWLKRIMDEEGVECRLVSNGFDFEYFKMSVPIEQKDRYRIAMVNQSMVRKECI